MSVRFQTLCVEFLNIDLPLVRKKELLMEMRAILRGKE